MRHEILISIGIIAATFVVATLFRYFFGRFILRSTRIMQNDPTNYRFLKHTLTGLIYVLGFSWAIYSIESMRTIANSMLAGAGILAVVVGFASQAALSNIISGVFIVLFKPFRINDRIILRDVMQGTVEDITLRHTVIRDLNNRRIVIPNSIISDEVLINFDMTDEKICRFVDIGISYDSNIQLAKKIIFEEAVKHPLYLDVRTPEQIEEGAPQVSIRVIGFGDSSVNLRAWVWANDLSEAFAMHCDLLETIKARFDQEGIEIPFPYRTLVLKNKLTLGDEKQEA